MHEGMVGQEILITYPSVITYYLNPDKAFKPMQISVPRPSCNKCSVYFSTHVFAAAPKEFVIGGLGKF